MLTAGGWREAICNTLHAPVNSPTKQAIRAQDHMETDAKGKGASITTVIKLQNK